MNACITKHFFVYHIARVRVFICRFYLFKIVVCGSFLHCEYLNGCDMRGVQAPQYHPYKIDVFMTYVITTYLTPHNWWGPQKWSST